MSPSEIESVTQLTLSTRQIKINAGEFDICLNFSDVIKNKDKIYINATSFLKESSKKKIRVEDFMNLKSTTAMIKAIEDDIFKSGESATFKNGVYFRKAGRYGGTWMCKLLFIDFVRWVDPVFSVACNKMLLQIFEYAYELSESRQQLKKLQSPLNDVIKKYIVDTGFKNESAYTQFAVMIKKMVGAPDERDTYTKHQLDTAQKIIEEYRAMIVHGKKTSLKEMNDYLRETELNLAWKPKQLLKG